MIDNARQPSSLDIFRNLALVESGSRMEKVGGGYACHRCTTVDPGNIVSTVESCRDLNP